MNSANKTVTLEDILELIRKFDQLYKGSKSFIIQYDEGEFNYQIKISPGKNPQCKRVIYDTENTRFYKLAEWVELDSCNKNIICDKLNEIILKMKKQIKTDKFSSHFEMIEQMFLWENKESEDASIISFFENKKKSHNYPGTFYPTKLILAGENKSGDGLDNFIVISVKGNRLNAISIEKECLLNQIVAEEYRYEF